MEASATPSALQLINQAHALIEEQYFNSRQQKGAEGRLEQKRLLLADLACHLGQDALKPADMNISLLKRHLYAILCLCDEFMPEHALKLKAEALLQEQQ